MNDQQHTLTLDGQNCAILGLPQVARDTLVSLQFVEARLQQLRDGVAVSQTAHVAYARALKAKLDRMSGSVLPTTSSPW